jgi:hypothetical protein
LSDSGPSPVAVGRHHVLVVAAFQFIPPLTAIPPVLPAHLTFAALAASVRNLTFLCGATFVFAAGAAVGAVGVRRWRGAALACGASDGCAERGRDSLRSAQLAAVKRHVDLHLADPGLTPAGAADALGMSVRQLHRLFEPSG